MNISKDWRVFAVKLSGVLAEMVEDQMLVISQKHSNRFVQFAAQGNFGMRVEVTSNAYLPNAERMKKMQITRLILAGWAAPTGKPGKSTPEKDPDGSPNYFIDYPAPIKPARISTQVMVALSDILRVPHPGYLEYKAFDTDGTSLSLPQLGIKRAEKAGKVNRAAIAKQLRSALREITGIKDLKCDKDGDFCLRRGNVGMYVRLIDGPPLVRIYAPLVQRVRESHRLYVRLNELNSELGFMHFLVRGRVIWGISEIMASPLHHDSLAHSMGMFSDVANGISGALQTEFGQKVVKLGEVESAMIH